MVHFGNNSPVGKGKQSVISIIQGTIGSGKSAVSLLRGIQHLDSGGVLALNYDLVPDWADRLSRKNIWVRLGLWDRKELADSYYKRCFKIGNVDSLYELAEKIPDLCKGWAKRQREGNALLIMDEAHLYFNSREWAKNKDFIQFFSQSRKLKYDVLMVAHGLEMIDKQIRFFVEIEERFRNLQKVRIPYTPIPFTPFVPVFWVARFYAGVGLGTGTRHSMSFYRFKKYYAELYDSWELFDYKDLISHPIHQGDDPSRKKKKKKQVYSGNIKGSYSLYPGIKKNTDSFGSASVFSA